MARSSRRWRLLTPFAIAGIFGLVAWVPTLSAAAAPPSLPAISAHDLLVKVQQAHVPGLSGVVQWSANLGLPDLGALGLSTGGSGFDPTSLLSGTHQIEVWDNGTDQQRLALPRTLGEFDIVHNGSQVWSYDSDTDQVTRWVAPAQSGHAGSSRSASGSDSADQKAAAPAGGAPLTPDQVATRILSTLSPSTAVTVSQPVDVAHHPAYVLTLAPAPGSAGAATSTISRVTLAVDAANGLPLRVQVFAKGLKSPALSLGYTQVSFHAVGASEFRAPTGTSQVTKTAQVPAVGSRADRTGSPDRRVSTFGASWAGVVKADQVDLGVDSRALDAATTPVQTAAGPARLLQTNVINVLILPGGGIGSGSATVVAGFVTPAALEAAASHP
jgi:outer membrane lipoprotein-sorting protein